MNGHFWLQGSKLIIRDVPGTYCSLRDSGRMNTEIYIPLGVHEQLSLLCATCVGPFVCSWMVTQLITNQLCANGSREKCHTTNVTQPLQRSVCFSKVALEGGMQAIHCKYSWAGCKELPVLGAILQSLHQGHDYRYDHRRLPRHRCLPVQLACHCSPWPWTWFGSEDELGIHTYVQPHAPRVCDVGHQCSYTAH